MPPVLIISKATYHQLWLFLAAFHIERPFQHSDQIMNTISRAVGKLAIGL